MTDHSAPHGASSLGGGDLEILEMIASGAPLRSVLDRLVRVIEARTDGMLGSVLLVENGRVRHGAAPHLPPDVAAIDGEPIGPAHGSCGTAAYRGETVVVEDIATSPLWVRYRDRALAAGLRACWSSPVKSADGSVLGTFALYFTQARAPALAQMALIRHASHLATIAIERDRHERALVASEARARLIIENALDANVIIDDQGIVTGWSPRAEDLFGWADTDAIGHPLSSLIIPPAQRAAHEDGLAQFRTTGTGPLIRRRVEVSAVHRDGREFPVELSITPIELDGRVSFSAFIADITSRKRAEDALRESEAHLSLVYEHTADVLFNIGVDADGDFRFVALNPAFYRATGLTPDAVNGKRVRDVLPEPSRSLVLAKYDEARRTRAAVRWEETTVFPAGKRHGEVAVTPVFDANGQLKSLIGSVRDVTDRHRLEHEMRQLQKMEAIGRLTGGIAHDFNNILGVILMRATMILETAANDDDREQITEIMRAGERGAMLTQQFLAFSRKQVLRPDVIALNTVVGNVQKMLRPVVGVNIEFRAELAADLWRVEADPGQIEQVIMNLVINARDAMPDGGTLTVATSNASFSSESARAIEIEPGEYVRLSVADTGIGMNEDTRSQIFEPFFTTKDFGQGTGLGLATVYGIVKQSGGAVCVESEPGRGSTFGVYLKRTLAEPVVRDARPPRRPSGKHRRGHVLVVEDEAPLRDALARLLPQLKCTVTVAANATEAIAHVEKNGVRPDLVITDVLMPGLGGIALVAHLRRVLPAMKVLCISGYPDGAAPNLAALPAGTPFLQKPFTAADLARVIDEALDSA